MSVFKMRFLTVLAGTALLSGIASAQEFRGLQGGSARVGHHDGALATDHPDRAFLRWWDPLFQVDTVIDNWMGSTVQNPPASWSTPAFGVIAGFYEDLGAFGNPPYYYAAPVPSKSYEEYWLPQPFGPAVSTFSWIFNGLTAGEEYTVHVNIPSGPSDTDPTAALNLFYQTQYAVYEISGVVNPDNPGQPVYQKVDTYSVGGGWVRLGNDGQSTTRVFTVDTASTSITVKLINTIPRDSQDNLVDTRSNICVYADAAKIERGGGQEGRIIASPVVGELTNAGAVFPWRVMSARNESFSAVDANILKSTDFGTLTSFRHNGHEVIAGDTIGRRNMVWSWPAFRPTSLTLAEDQRFAQEKLDYLNGVGKYPSATKRFDQAITVDNTNGAVVATAGFLPLNAPAGFKGTDFLQVAGVAGGLENVVFSPKLADSSYAIDVWCPGGATYSDGVEVLIRVAGTVLGTVNLNMQTAGWRRLNVGTTYSFPNTLAAPLNVVITNNTTGTAGLVAADMVRFTRVADLSMRSTPVFARVDVDTGAGVQTRDVVIVAQENGRISCLDAEGTKVAGVPTGDTPVYWTYPSEIAVDPNHAVGLDGPDGMAEMPTGFDLSSALVENVGGQDRLYIASTNGRVYCLDMQGRGDGTTTRVWSYPDDYPSPSVESRLGRITGSLAFQVTAAGPTLFVPTPQGRLYALDATGNNVTKTTTERWTYPDLAANPIGPIYMTPAVAFNKVFFGTNLGSFAGNSTLFALDVDDTNADNIGDVVWSKTTSGTGTFQPFGYAGPATAPAADVDGIRDYLFIANNNFDVYAIDANTGADVWQTGELGASPSASLGFTWMRVPNNLDVLTNMPMVMVPTTDGRYTSLMARPGDLNVAGGRESWSVRLYGSDDPPAMAFGAKDATLPNPEDDEFSWMYGADSKGFLYAFNYDPDFPDGNQTITPGLPPIEQPGIIDNLSLRLNDIVTRAKGSLITPDAYRDMLEKQRAGTLTYADITAAVDQVTRQHYEFGETLYFVIYDLADPNFYTPVTPYTLDLTFNSPGSSSQRRAYSVTTVGGAPNINRNQAALVQWTLLPIGGNALVPGKVGFTFRIVSSERQGANRTIAGSKITPNTAPLGGGSVQLANPLAISIVQNPVNAADHVGYTLSPSSNEAANNGNIINPTTGLIKPLDQNFAPDSNSAGDEVAHGQDGVTQMFVYDRSLLTLVYGPDRGLQNLRVQLSDLWWPTLVSPLKPFVLPSLAGLEDLPGSAGNNVSLDYPDIRRDRMDVTKTQFGSVENPLYQPVSLIPPVITAADSTSYRTNVATYNNFLNRTLMPTTFDFNVKVPQYQPPAGNSNYAGTQYVYVDAGNPGRNFQGAVASEAFRQFGLHADVALDERLSVGKPTVDLNIIPGGGGYSPLAPWNDPAFGLLNVMFQDSRNPFWNRFIVLNEGNVNLLRVRLAKRVQDEVSAAIDPVMFFAPGLAPRSWLDARWHMHSDLDPQFLPGLLFGNAVLQKARPGDNEPTRFRVNPKVRRNPNLGVNDGDLFGVASFPNAQAFDESKLDPKLAVSIPIGAPVGQYQQSIYTIEDRTDTAFDRSFPALEIEGAGATYEPYADPPMMVRFQVRESRLTTRNSIKTAPMADNLGLSGTEPLTWQNGQPTVARNGSGTLFVGFTSDRLTAANAPGFLSRPKVSADTEAASRSRIYIASLALGTGTPTAAHGIAGVSDLSTFANANPNRWFEHALSGYPTQSPGVLFGVPAVEIDPATVAFQNPTFPSGGTFDTTGAISATGRPDRGYMYMAFTGTADRLTAGGERRNESRLFISTLAVGAGSAVTPSAPVPLNVAGDSIDPLAKIGKPSMIQHGQFATVFYPVSSSSGSQIAWSSFNGNDWQPVAFGRRTSYVESLALGSAFESASNPSAILRSYRGTATSRIEMTFNARMKGRSQPEVYMARMETDNSFRPRSIPGSNSYMLPYGVKMDRLEQDPRTGLYWSSGSEWLRRPQDITPTAEVPTNPLSANFIDVKTFNTASSTWTSVLDYASLKQEEGSAVLTFNSTFGGKVYVDTSAGTVRFSGAMIPANSVLWVRSNPRFVRIAGLDGMNYRGPSLQFDERYIVDNSYWLTVANLGMPLGFQARNDRFVVGYAKTSANSTDRSRPYMKTLRFGVQLPSAVATNDAGVVSFMTVGGVNTPYQIEPSTGKLYFMAEMEDRVVNVSYDGVDQHGRPLGRINIELTVGYIEETQETPIPMNDVANESAVAFALDPVGGGYSVNGGSLIPFNGVNAADRRPGLIWMFWSSTRGGGSDVYFQTVAPRFGSIRAGN